MTGIHGGQMNEAITNNNRLVRADHIFIESTLDLLSPRWTSSILIELLSGRKRTAELLRALPGLSAKTLSERLKRLQEFDLISRTVYPEVPPRVEYELTEDGMRLSEALIVLKDLGHLCQVH